MAFQKIMLLACILLIGCITDEPFRSILPEDAELKAGDVVFRRGGGLTSRAVLMADVQGQYSHIGIVVDSARQKMIVHAVPGEPDFEGDEDRVKTELVTNLFDRKSLAIQQALK